MSNLPLYTCSEFYQAHHSECPARKAYEKLERIVEQLQRALVRKEERLEKARAALREAACPNDCYERELEGGDHTISYPVVCWWCAERDQILSSPEEEQSHE